MLAMSGLITRGAAFGVGVEGCLSKDWLALWGFSFFTILLSSFPLNVILIISIYLFIYLFFLLCFFMILI